LQGIPQRAPAGPVRPRPAVLRPACSGGRRAALAAPAWPEPGPRG